MATVYWAARDLDSYAAPIGNHHFILIVLSEHESIATGINIEGTTRFATLGAFKDESTERLVFTANKTADVMSVREVLDPGKHRSWYAADFDMERHAVSAPRITGLALAQKLVLQAQTYARNEALPGNNIAYSLIDENCAAWVNIMFKAAGISEADRLEAGEFSGVDWGEEDSIPESLFR